MVIISKAVLVAFGKIHADSIEAFNIWYEKIKKADWNNLTDIKKIFNTVDYVGNDGYVFNIKGNHYRLVVMIFLE